MSDPSIDIDVQIQIEVVQQLLLHNPSFVNQLRLELTKDVRGKGDNLGKWAQRPPRPKTIQPNTVQRVW